MYNYQNNLRNVVLAPKTVTESESKDRKRREESRVVNDKGKSGKVLKIFAHSEEKNYSTGRLKNSKKKVSSHAYVESKIFDVGQKSEKQREGRKNPRNETGEERTINYFDILTSQLLRASKREGDCKADKKGEKTGLEYREILTAFKNNEQEKPNEKGEVSSCHMEPELANSLEAKTSTKVTEMKPTASECKKMQINEILKSHAQKTPEDPSNSSQIIKEIYQKGKTETEGKGNKDEKKEEPKKVEQEDLEKKEEADENRKKMTEKLMKLPQSKELERRLTGSWSALENLVPKQKTSKSSERNIKEGEEEKKEEKRKTLTDRLILARKEKEEKKMMASEESVGTETESPNLKKPEEPKADVEKIEKPIRNIMMVSDSFKEILTPELRSVFTTKKAEETNLNAPEVLSTKCTRSVELKEMVVQAIKDHKIFCIFDNHWYIVRPVREELLKRGWMEVIPDRRLIPRRRPPPPGPVLDKPLADRNSCTLAAILSIRETFVEEIQETVSKTFTFSVPSEKKISLHSASLKKHSDDCLNEVASLFRIMPPNGEKKRNNFDIREFVSKCHLLPEKKSDKELNKDKENEKEKAKTTKVTRRDKLRSTSSVQFKNQKNKSEVKSLGPLPVVVKLNPKYNEVAEKTIYHLTPETKKSEEKADRTEAVDVKRLTSVEFKEKEEREDADLTPKPMFSESEAKAISKTIQSMNAKINLMWLSIKPSIHLKCFNYSPEIVNKFQRTTFCTKIGLWNHLNNIQWHGHEVHRPAKSPRMYNTGEADDLRAFFQDFQLTACIGILKWLADTFFDKGIKAVQRKKGKVPLKAFEFAIKQCERYIRFKNNEDLSIVDDPKILKDEWNTFLEWFYIITNDHGKLQETPSPQLMVVYTKAVETLKSMRKYWPEMDIDGRLNIWIMKPYCASCGRGIFMTNNVYYIGQHSKYIVQKYIERPLLIYNTKFDIRQWFMLTKLIPLEIWMYKECYLRFCTQPFALRNLHESVHLSNNSVQRKYTNLNDLPDQNMWDLNTFKLYLKTIGQSNIWQDIIYPGMRDAIISTMLAAQDTFDGPRKNWFEVYGADFMLSSNLQDGPWLIEINENPAMDPSTKVTARLCPQMLRDVIKVVVDKRTNKYANTGQWELIYRQNYSPSFSTCDLDVKGRKITRVPHSVNLTLQPGTVPLTARKFNENNVDNRNLYDIVKSYENKQNSKEVWQNLASKIKEKSLPYDPKLKKSKVNE